MAFVIVRYWVGFIDIMGYQFDIFSMLIHGLYPDFLLYRIRGII